MNAKKREDIREELTPPILKALKAVYEEEGVNPDHHDFSTVLRRVFRATVAAAVRFYCEQNSAVIPSFLASQAADAIAREWCRWKKEEVSQKILDAVADGAPLSRLAEIAEEEGVTLPEFK